jgi:hypothetical protein
VTDVKTTQLPPRRWEGEHNPALLKKLFEEGGGARRPLRPSVIRKNKGGIER